jgi:branched-chain amino acid transport system substrate-binding protein
MTIMTLLEAEPDSLPRRTTRRRALACVASAFTAPAWAQGMASNTAPIVIHHIGPFTGALANSNRESLSGAHLHFKMVNDAGGVYGRRLELETLDDQQDAKRSAQLFRELLQTRRVLTLFMPRTTPAIEAMIPLAEEFRVPMVAPQTGGSFITEPAKRYVFAVRASYRAEAEYAIEHQHRVGVRRFAVVHASDSFGTDTLVGVNAVMARLGLRPLAVEPVDNRNPDVTRAVATMLRERPDSVLLIVSSKAASDFVKGYQAGGGRSTYITLSNTSTAEYVKLLGPQGRGAIVMQVLPTPFVGTTALSREFAAASGGEKVAVSYASLQGYVSAKVLVEGLRRAGATPTPDSLTTALQSLRDLNLGGYTLRFGPNQRAGSGFIEATMISRDGRFIR